MQFTLPGINLQYLADFTRLRTEVTPRPSGSPAPLPAAAAQPPPGPDLALLGPARLQIARLLDGLVKVDRLVNGATRLQLPLPVANSVPLELDLAGVRARTGSTEELNTAPHSYAPAGPTWSSTASTALLTLSGDYNGSNGSGNLRFEAFRGGVHGVNRLQIRVRSPTNALITTVVIQASDPIDRQYNLPNGLTLQLGPGSLQQTNFALSQVYAGVGSAVNPTNPFNGTRNSRANLQTGLPTIVAGSFQLNGTGVVVDPADTLNAVIDRINQSGSGVTATFDPVTERVSLVQQSAGSEPGIVLAAGSSNFLQAAKLAGAITTPGVDPDDMRPLGQIARFAGLTDGELRINGKSVALDPVSDSLRDVVGRINGLGVGALASFDPGSQQLALAANRGRGTLHVDGNGTGFFAALGISEGRVQADEGASRRRLDHVGDAIAELVNGINALIGEGGLLAGPDPAARSLRQALQAAVAAAFDGGRDSGTGLRLREAAGADGKVTLAAVDRRELDQAIRRRGRGLRTFLDGADGRSGALGALAGALGQAAAVLGVEPGGRGTIVDILA
jgi:hypothetical protein